MRSERYEDSIAMLPVLLPLIHHLDPLLFAYVEVKIFVLHEICCQNIQAHIGGQMETSG